MPIAKAPVENNTNYRVTDKLNKARGRTNKGPRTDLTSSLLSCFSSMKIMKTVRKPRFFDTGTAATI